MNTQPRNKTGGWAILITLFCVLAQSAFAQTISSVSPNPLTGANTASTLTVNGSGFVSGATVRLRCPAFGVDTTKSATFINSGQLQVSATFGTDPSSWTAQVINPSTATSAQFSFTVQAPTPVIVSLSPNSASAGGAAFTMRVNGSTFHQTSVVRWNGANRTTTPVVSAGGLTTALDAQITASDIASAGTATVTVNSPGPGGGTSAGATFTINSTGPTISSVSPNPLTGANTASTLTVNGSGFVSGATVRLRCPTFGVDTTKSATFINSGQLQVSATFGTDPSSWTAQVINPSTATSSQFSFTVQAPSPVIVSLSPNSAAAGGAAFTLRVNGDTFHQASVVRWNGANRTTTPVVSAGGLTTALDAQITASDIVSAGTATVTVNSPGPGGGTSSGATFTINSTGPSITSVSPNPLTGANTASTLTVNGAGFVSGATVRLRCPSFGVDTTKSATFINSGQLQVSATFGTDPSSWTAQVINPSTATSSQFGFTVQAPAPVIGSLSPNSAAAGGAAFTLRVNGDTFHQASVVRWNGANRTTTPVVSAGGLTTALDAQITASDIASAGTATVTVNSPAPGGGTSSGVTFTINSSGPTISSVSPNPLTGANTASTLTVNGSGFVSGATVRLRCPAFGVDTTKSATFVNSGQLQVSATFGTDPSSWTAQVINPSTATSSQFSFTVQAPSPVIISLSPSSKPAGAAAFTLRVNGDTFHQASVVRWNGANRTTTPVVSAGGLTTALDAQITASDIASAGTATVTVNSPGPGGGTSAGATFTISGSGPVLAVTPANPPIQSASAGSLNLSVNNTGGGAMSYSASVTSGSSWLSITSGGSGGNSGTIALSLSANPGAQQSGTVQVTASGASGSPLTVTIIQAGASGGNVMLPGTISYIRQLGIGDNKSDMHMNFNSAAACGPCSAVMILTYYDRLMPHPMIGKSGQNNDFSWYVAPIDQNGNPSSTAYSYTNFPFNVGIPDPAGQVNYGAHGFLIENINVGTVAYRAVQYFWKHGLWAAYDASPTEAKVRTEIDAGRPVFLSTQFSSGGHIMVIRGYNATQLIAADPWIRSDLVNRDFYNYTWNEIHYPNPDDPDKWMIKNLAPVIAGARVKAIAVDPFNIREQPNLSANPVGAMRTAGQLGTVVLDGSKNSTFWNADGYTWVKILWDSDQVVGWSAIGSGSALWIEPISSPLPTVATPTVTPAGGSFNNSVQVTLACSTSGATIRYTTDGSSPTSSSPIYSLPFTLTSSANVKAKAFASGYNESAVASASFTVTPTPTVATPTISPAGGSFSGSVQVTLACTTSGATIRYTTDGSTPTSGSPAYIVPFTLTSSATVKAKAFASGYNDSAAASASFTVTPAQTVATPTITPAGGSFIGSVQVTLACATSGSTIRYTTDGNDPTGSSPVYVAAFTLTSSATVKAKGFASGYTDSGIATASFTVTPPTVATPTIAPAGGSFNGSVQVTLACATAGSTIRYTTDGSNPTSGSLAYTTPFTLNSSVTVKAKAFASGYTDSTVASAGFTIVPISTVATPTITPSGGTFNGSVQVSLTCATSGAIIRYTTDGNDPTGASPIYAGPFTLASSAAVKAKAFAGGYTDSAIASASFTIIPLAITGIGGGPVLPPNSGIFQIEVHSSQPQVTVQVSGDLLHWIDVGAFNIVDGKAYFVDGSAGASTKRFYRLKP